MWIRVCRYKNAGVAGYAEAFRSVQSDSPTSNWYSYFENNVLVQRKLSFCYIDAADEKSDKSIWRLLNIRCTRKQKQELKKEILQER